MMRPQAEDRKTILELSQVSFVRGYETILDRVSFSLSEGEVCGILGPSGVGKSTLLDLVMGKIQPSSGSLSLRCRFCCMPQDLALVPSLSAEVNVKLASLISKERETAFAAVSSAIKASAAPVSSELTELLVSLGLPKSLHSRKVMQLSGGEQARVAIARVLASSACLMIFDEPISHLDWDRADEVLKIIRKECIRRKRAAILVLHDSHFAEKFCDHLVHLRPKCNSQKAELIW